MNPPSSQQNNSPARDRVGRQQAFSRARRKDEDDGDKSNGISSREVLERPRRKSVAVNRPGETFTARDRPFSSASHTSLKAAFEATKSLPLEPILTRGSRTSLLSSPDQNKKSYIPVRARPAQPDTRITNKIPSQTSGRRSPRARRAQMSRGRGSSSSPPRGLREAYARIVDEENLAAEESALGELEDEPDDSAEDWSSPRYIDPKELRDQDRGRFERIKNSESPLSLPRPRPGSPLSGLRSLGKPTDSKYQELDESTLDLSGSIVSGISSLENGTDDSFVQTLARHARDQQRVNGALKSENRVFSRARKPERAGLTGENLRRNDKVDEISAIEREVAVEASSVTSDVSDIPVRIPKDWGRKGRKRNDWLSKIQEAEDAETRRKDDERDEDSRTGRAEPSQREESTIDWVAAAADIPLPSVEDKASLDAYTQQTVTPPPSRQQTSSAERVEQPYVEDELIPRYSLISSKPVVRSKNNILDRIRDREIEALKGQAVTTSRLGELKERTSREQLRPRRASGQSGEKPDEDPPIVKARKRSLGLDSQDSGPSSSQEKEGDDGSESSRTKSEALVKKQGDIDNGSQKTDQTDKETVNDKPPNSAQQNRGTLEQKKGDYRDLLLQLARAASNSPSPAPETHYRDKRTLSEELNRSEESQKQSGPASGEDKSTFSSREPAKNFRDAKQDVTKESDIDGDSGPKPVNETIESQTPALAIGGWVNTPATTIPKINHPPLNSSLDHSVDQDIPASDARNFIRDANLSPLHGRSSGLTGRPGKDDQVNLVRIGLQRTISAPEPDRHPTQGSYRQLEAEIDSTIDSIDQLIANNEADITSLRPNDGPGLSRFEVQDHKDKPLSDAERERGSEVLAYERMNEKLQMLRLSIHDAKKGIESLEDQVQHTTPTGQPEVGACSQCGRLGAMYSAGEHSHQMHLQLPFPLPKIYRWNEASRRPRLTWLGAFCLMLAVIYGYFLAERITCELFCPKHVDPNDITNNPSSHRLGLFTLYHGENYYAVWPPYAIWGTLRWAFPGYFNPLAYQLCRTSQIARSTMKQTCQELCVWDGCRKGLDMEDELWQEIREMNHIYGSGD